MRSEILRKMRKCDPKELLFWVSVCQLPPVNRERAAIIEYALGVLVSLDYRRAPSKRKISRGFVKRIFSEAYKDFENCLPSPPGSELQAFFPLGFLGIRAEAFPWQFAQAALDRYGPHKEWMLKQLGFTIIDAVDFSKGLMKYSIRRSLEFGPPSFPPFVREQYYNPEYVMVPKKAVLNFWKEYVFFSKNKIESLFPENKLKELNRFLERMSVSLDEIRPMIKGPLDFNIFHAKPFVRIGEDFILPLPRLLWYAISTTFHYDLLHDRAYRGKYIDEKGKVAEKRMQTYFSKIFPGDKLFPRVKYNKRKGWPDIDLIIEDKDAALFVECTAKWITRKAKKGDLTSIINDLRYSVEKCSKQLARAFQAHREGKMAEIKTDKLLPVIVVDDYIPGLDLILKFHNFSPDPLPYIINIFDLDIITDLTSKENFIDFVSKRIELSKRKRIFASDEIDYFVLYRLHGFDEYIRSLERTDSELHYIGHLENLDPMYYKDHFIQFIDDPVLSNWLELIDMRTGWS